jgi:hypothetical protein
VTDIDNDGSLTVTKLHGHGTVTLPPDYVIDHVRLGYAATEYGHQSITTDTSITLATGATTCRGLYVAMSRGRHDNTVHVVTDTHDPAEARDALERILANERADLPAVSQRRGLAAQDHKPVPLRPRLTPRCTVPPSFDQLLADATDQLAAIRHAIAESPARRTELTGKINRAEQKAAAAAKRHAPFAALMSDANDKLKDARESMYAASAELRTANALARRGARRRSDLAHTAVDNATEDLNVVRKTARPTSTTLYTAEEATSRARGALQALDVADRYTNPERLETAERRVDALEIWRQWASGRNIPAERVLEIANDLSASSRREVAALIRPLETWLTDQGIEPLSRNHRAERSMDFGIER